MNNKIICQKKLDVSSKLVTIRELIKDKIGQASFIDRDGNILDTNDENEFTLEDILYDNILKVKGQNANNSGIVIFLNNNNFCTINIDEGESLSKLRIILNDKVQNNFDFIDLDGNSLDKPEENDFSIKDILKDNMIKIKTLINETPNKLPNDISNNQSNNISNENISKQNTPSSDQKETGIPKVNYDLSKYKKIKEEDGLIFYLYSEKQYQQNPKHKLVRQYYFDEFKNVNNDQEAKIILFVGKTGDGKTTAINAFFNVIKGVRLEDKFRFILIKEPKKDKGQAESQTDGVHIYYITDANNKPIIILDSQGFGDTRGKNYDLMVIEAFTHIFSEVIDHINATCFIVKSTDSRLDINIKYIFNQVTGLFSENIAINFFVLATHAIRQNIDDEPAMIKTLGTDKSFQEIRQKMQNKWYYAIDSTTIMESDLNKMAKFSYAQLVELYNERVIKSRPISVKKCSEVLNIRRDLVVQINNLHTTFKNLILEQGNLKEKEKAIQGVDIQILQAEQKIKENREKFKNLKGADLEKAMNELNEDINRRIYEIGNREEKKQVRTLSEGTKGFEYCHCQECKENCHDPCDCIHLFTTRCTIYPVFGDKCERCGHKKGRHSRDGFRYKYEYISVKTIDADEIERAKQEKRRREAQLNKDINEVKRKKNSIEQSLSNLENTIAELRTTKELNQKQKIDIEKKVKDNYNEILIIIVRLQSASQRLNDISMRPDYHKTDNEYIDSLIDKYKEVYGENCEKIKELEKLKKLNEKFLNTTKLKKEELFKLDHSQLADLLKNLDI